MSISRSIISYFWLDTIMIILIIEIEGCLILKLIHKKSYSDPIIVTILIL